MSYVLYIMSLTACLALFRSFFALDLDIAQNSLHICICAYQNSVLSLFMMYMHPHVMRMRTVPAEPLDPWISRSRSKLQDDYHQLHGILPITEKDNFSLENIACSSFINNLSGIVWLDCVWLTRGGVILNVKGSGKEIMT